MLIDLAKLQDSSLPFEFSVSAEALDLGVDNFRLRDRAVASGEIKKTSAQVNVDGTIKASVEIDCTRCLSPIEQDLLIEFSVGFVRPEDFVDAENAELEAADLDTDILEGDALDLKQVVREQILLNLPTQILCRENCKGLCPQCGANLNLIDCKCEEDEIDPRWAALKNLK